MDSDPLESELLEVARRCGVSVRREAFDPKVFGQAGRRGGLCVLAGRRVILLDTALAGVDRAALLAEALSTLDLSGIDVPGAARNEIARHTRRRDEAARARRARLRRVV